MTHKITYLSKDTTSGREATFDASVLTSIHLTEASPRWEELTQAFKAYQRQEEGSEEVLAKLLVELGQEDEEKTSATCGCGTSCSCDEACACGRECPCDEACACGCEKDEIKAMMNSFSKVFLEGADRLRESITRDNVWGNATRGERPVPPPFDPFDMWRRQGYHGHHEAPEAKAQTRAGQAAPEAPILPTPEELRLLKEDLKTVAEEAKAEAAYWARTANDGLERAARRGKIFVLRKLAETMMEDAKAQSKRDEDGR